jgi:hypothetical protein
MNEEKIISEKNVKQNVTILIGSAILVAILVIVPFVFPKVLITILRGFTGWSTFAVLFVSLIAYCGLTKECKLLRFFTIPMLTILTSGYFLYLIFGLEAYKFACSALVFDVGTALVGINIIARLWTKLRS